VRNGPWSKRSLVWLPAGNREGTWRGLCRRGLRIETNVIKADMHGVEILDREMKYTRTEKGKKGRVSFIRYPKYISQNNADNAKQHCCISASPHGGCMYHCNPVRD
jgi:hypothetical protein